MTEITYTPQQPHLIEQELTGVRQAYRGRGLGKWLKAEMLFFIRSEYPDARFVDTGNADHNAPMLSINQRMGFENLLSQTFFEFDVGDLSQRLKGEKQWLTKPST
jgi:GNAT superfamily N-acetyltransferase